MLKRLDRRTYLTARLQLEHQPELALDLNRELPARLAVTVDDLAHLGPVGTDQRTETIWFDVPARLGEISMAWYAPPRNAIGFLRTLSGRQALAYWLLDLGVGGLNRSIFLGFNQTGVIVQRSPHFGARLGAATGIIDFDAGIVAGGTSVIGYSGGYLVQGAYALTHHHFPIRWGWGLMLILDPSTVNAAMNVGMTIEEFPLAVIA